MLNDSSCHHFLLPLQPIKAAKMLRSLIAFVDQERMSCELEFGLATSIKLMIIPSAILDL
jgi:hypothetical protein